MIKHVTLQVSITLYPPNLTSPKNNNPNYTEGSSAARVSYQRHRGPSRICSAPHALKAPQARSTLPASVRTRGPALTRSSRPHHGVHSLVPPGCLLRPPTASSGLSGSPQSAIGGGHLLPWPKAPLLPLPLPPSLASSSLLRPINPWFDIHPWLQITQSSQRLPGF